MRLTDELRSDRVRFTLSYVLVFLISAAALGFATFRGIEQAMIENLRSRITAETAQLMGDYRDDGLPELRHDIDERLEASPAHRLHYVIRGPDGRAIFDDLVPMPTAEGWATVSTPEGAEVLCYAQPLDDGFLLVVGADLETVASLRVAARQRLWMVLALTLVVGIAGGVVVMRRNRRRVEAFSETARRVGRGALDERLQLTGEPGFDALATTINDMLERIEYLVDNTRRVTSHVAHDLRTPLSRLRQRLEELQKKGGASVADLEAATRELDACLETFAAVLRIAEVESGVQRAGFQAVDVSSMLDKVIDAYQPVAEEEGAIIHTDYPTGITFDGDTALLSQAVANLLDNALLHGAPPIGVSAGPGWIRVEDRGPGVPEDERTRVLEPFHRLDGSRTTAGNGLGLSLVHSIAKLHDGEVLLEDAEPGLRVTLMLPGRPR